MPCLFVLVTVSIIVSCLSEVVYVKDDGETQKFEIRDNDTLVRTQFLPTKNEEVADRRIDFINKCEILKKEDTNIRNSSYEMRDGKLYKITRVKKKVSREPCIANVDSMERRLGQPDPARFGQLDPGRSGHPDNLGRKDPTRSGQPDQLGQSDPKRSGQPDPSIVNSPDMTMMSRQSARHFGSGLFGFLPQLSSGNWQADPVTKENNGTWQFWTGSHPITTKTISRKRDKIKKLLNLFTIVQFDNEGCIIDGLKGTCYHQSECGEKGGRPLGPCARGFGVCCIFERSCGQTTNENCTYFVNEDFPMPTSAGPGICALSVLKAHPQVKQLRLEFETFEMRGPVNGSCLLDRFLVTGQNRNSIVPDLCGVNTGQHVYVDVDATSGPFSLNVITMGQNARKWRVKVTQLRPDSELLAPSNCLQYFTELSGVIESFNYQNTISGNVGEASPEYLNNLNYDACIKKGDAFCTVTYSNQPNGELEHEFELINYDKEGETIIPRGQAGAEVFNCPDDYIIINGVRLCGDRLNDATLELDYTKSAPVTDRSAGPAHLSVRTNEDTVSRGFRLIYRQNPCID